MILEPICRVRATRVLRPVGHLGGRFLMLGQDGNRYVVRLQGNWRGKRALASEMLATLLAESIGLPVLKCVLVDVDPSLLETEAGRPWETPPTLGDGPQFGTIFIPGLFREGGQIDLSERALLRTSNLGCFEAILPFDKWVGNAGRRTALFRRRWGGARQTAVFHSFINSFGAGAWTFTDAPLRGTYKRRVVYRRVAGWRAFQPWLGRIEEMPREIIYGIANKVPVEWFSGDMEARDYLLEQLLERRDSVRESIEAVRNSSARPFPRWVGSSENQAVCQIDEPTGAARQSLAGPRVGRDDQ